jgi:hypothetical protein
MPFNINGQILTNTQIKLYNNKNIVRSGLTYYIDAGISESYPGSGTTWNDLSTNNYTSTLTNGPTYNTGNGGVIVFDGSNDYVNGGNRTIAVSSGFTIDMWLRLGANNRQQGFFGFTNYPAFITNFWMNTNNLMRFELGINADIFASPSVNSTSTFSTGVWYHVVGTATNSALSIYVNGSFQASTSISQTITQMTGTISVGSYSTAAFYGNASISNTKLYNRALTAAEVLQNFNATRKRFNV